MSPAKSKSKSKEKASTLAAKERQKVMAKNSGSSVNIGTADSASAQNPVSGTLQAVDTVPLISSPPIHNNGRYRSIDETDEHTCSSHVAATEYDVISNNGSCSGESEDHKDKCAPTTSIHEIPGSDNDKREKIRQKNEKKHQRQKERRALELHERCCGYLMSRKLEALSQQLVAMGFSSERATLALMLNEGKLEESVSWLFEGSEEESQNKDLASGANLKIDVSEELAQIVELEVRYKSTKQEVERAIVACEGNLEKAEETLRAQKPEPPAIQPKPEVLANHTHSIKQLEKPTVVTSRNERDFNYANGGIPTSTVPEPASRNLQDLKSNQMKVIADKRWMTTGTNLSSSYPMAMQMQVAPSSSKMMAQHNVGGGNEGRSFQQLAMRDPVIVMQRPQSRHIKQISSTSLSASPPGTAGWYPNNVLVGESMKLSSKFLHNQNTGSFAPETLSPEYYYPRTHSSRSLDLEIMSSQQYYPQTQHVQQKHFTNPVEPAANKLGNSWSKAGASSPSLAIPSSLGLFSGWSSTGTMGSSPHVDWNTREMMSYCDYNSIDWTLESKSSSLSSSSKPNGLMGSSKPNGLMMGLSSARMDSQNGICLPGLQDGGMPTDATSAGLREWTSPFAGKDIFSLPRQFVTSPPSN